MRIETCPAHHRQDLSVRFAAVVCAVAASCLLAARLGVAATAPTITLPALAAPAGASLEVEASGFAASAALSIELDDQAIGSGTTDGAGNLAPVTVQLPAGESTGRHVVTVLDAVGGESARSSLTVEAPGAPEVIDRSLGTRSVGVVHFAVSLPAEYATSGKRYPVIYFLHGLPAGELAYLGWPALLDGALGPSASSAIVVAPQAARAGDTDPEYLDWGSGRDWATALAVELPRYVDAHFRTIPTREGRALVGVSAGGYGAILMGLRHLGTFSVIESWSGYFQPTDPAGRATLTLASEADNARASAYTLVPRLRALFRREPTFLGFYVGRQDGLFRGDNARFHARLVSAGVPHAFAVYPGAHQMSLWSGHAGLWLGLALRHLATPG